MTSTAFSPTLRVYQDWTTAMHIRVNAERGNREHLTNCVLGICGELGELFAPTADIVLEAGDVLSYVAMAASVVGVQMQAWIDESFTDSTQWGAHFHQGGYPPRLEGRSIFELDTCRTALRLAEVTKKEVFQGRATDPLAWDDRLSEIFYRVGAVAGAHGHTLRRVLDANVEKLTARYPEPTP